MFLDRSRRAGRYLEWKVRLFTLAAVLTVVGIALDERWMTGTATALLVGGLALRFLPAARGEESGAPEDAEDPEDQAPQV